MQVTTRLTRRSRRQRTQRTRSSHQLFFVVTPARVHPVRALQIPKRNHQLSGALSRMPSSLWVCFVSKAWKINRTTWELYRLNSGMMTSLTNSQSWRWLTTSALWSPTFQSLSRWKTGSQLVLVRTSSQLCSTLLAWCSNKVFKILLRSSGVSVVACFHHYVTETNLCFLIPSLPMFCAFEL